MLVPNVTADLDQAHGAALGTERFDDPVAEVVFSWPWALLLRVERWVDQGIKAPFEGFDMHAGYKRAEFHVRCQGGPCEVRASEIGTYPIGCEELDVGKRPVVPDTDDSEVRACAGAPEAILEGSHRGASIACACVSDGDLYSTTGRRGERDREDV